MCTVDAIPAFRDNYIWAMYDEQHAALVDPGEAEPALAWLEKNNLTPCAILITHHHADHCGGVAELTRRWQLPVYGPAGETIHGVTHAVDEADQVDIKALDLHFQVMATPGHTLGHVCYFGHGRLFSGDTLFSCGCGRLFEGSAVQMHSSLLRLAQLPGETGVHCAHEYTMANLAFALELEPDNPDLRARLDQAGLLRKNGLPTLPVDIATERRCNPFLRCDQTAVIEAVSQHLGRHIQAGEETFAALRALKDAY